MPVMSRVERAFCRSAPWRAATGRLVLPWVLGDLALEGEVLEIGSGAGANAQVLVQQHPEIRLVATDLDPLMVASARRRLSLWEDRVDVTEASAVSLPLNDGRFDVVVSFLMLHHVIEWEAALHEAARVLRPGGTFVGYDLTNGLVSRAVHVVDRSPHRLIAPRELRVGLAAAGFHSIHVDTRFGGTVARFVASTPQPGHQRPATARALLQRTPVLVDDDPGVLRPADRLRSSKMTGGLT